MNGNLINARLRLARLESSAKIAKGYDRLELLKQIRSLKNAIASFLARQ